MPGRSRGRAARAAHAFFHAAPIAAFALLAFAPLPSLARDYALGALRVDHPYARPTPPGARTGGIYMTIRNTGNEPDRLVGAESAAAQSVEVHSMKIEGDVMRMRAVPALEIPAGGEVTLGSGGYHVMLLGIKNPLKIGDAVPVTLKFARAGTLDVLASVETPQAAGGHKH